MTNPSTELERLLDVPVQLEAVLPSWAMRVGDLLALAEGSIVKTSHPSGETVELLAGGAPIGFAELSGANGRRAARMVRFSPGSH
jgi:flagellar motor switch/type III secretory pathway protein FliN